jgi:ATP-binding cassette subfamily B protein
MTLDIRSMAWPAVRLNEAVEILAQKTGFPLDANLDAVAPPPIHNLDGRTLGDWIEGAAGRLGLEAEAVSTTYTEVGRMVQGAGPALLALPDHPQSGFLVILKARRGRVSVITPELAVRHIPPAIIQATLTREIEAPLGDRVDRLLATTGVPLHRRARARQAILDEQLGEARIEGCWLLRQLPGADFWSQIRRARLPRYVAMIAAADGVYSVLQAVGWWIILQGALQGRFDSAWLWAWCLLLFSAVPFQVLALWLHGLVSVGEGALFKRRLLYGALQLDPEEVRHQGVGQFLGRVLESEAVEMLALSGGFATVTAMVQLILATVVLAHGASGWLHVTLLWSWLALALFLGWRYYLRNRDWRLAHQRMINALVERMVGHRTRLAQEPALDWHREEDQTLAGYARLSQRLDAIEARMSAAMGRGWLLLGLAGLAYPLLAGTTAPVALAISLGGIMLAYQAFGSLVEGTRSIVGIVNAWKQVAPLFQAAARAQRTGGNGIVPIEPMVAAEAAPSSAQPGRPGGRDQVVARDLFFRYREYAEPVLRGCSLRIAHGDRLLLEGASGAGKSTLAAVLTGLRTPLSGLLMLNGLDRQTLGTQAWRRRIVGVPQFHENHVLAETFAFNLLLGRGWPPTADDLAEAEQLCHELGLGELLARMSAGLQQMVGETGWRLSHGERSRLYVARALLQRADVIVLDESFAALDPENLQRVLRCVLRRAPTLLVIAHP